MINFARISTENPAIEQWRLLNRFSYPPNIRKFMSSNGFHEVENDQLDLIAGSIRQGEAYFNASQTSPIDITPLLLYYGATNLFLGISVLKTNKRIKIKNHGMILIENDGSRIADAKILPKNPAEGALQVFCDVFSPGCVLTNGTPWSMGEILGSIPDLLNDFENQYNDFLTYTVPVETVHLEGRTLDRILLHDLGRFESPQKGLALVPGLTKAYLSPQLKKDYVILNYTRNHEDIGVYSISGRKYLPIGHEKQNQLINPGQLISMYMGLYVLGLMPRYRPELWNPFVNSDKTGEKYIIEKFLSICQRYLPHLILNFINNQRILFVNETEGIVDMRTGKVQK